MQITGNIGEIFISSAGCIHVSQEYFNGYSIVETKDGVSWTVTAREFYKERNVFDQSLRFASDGKKTFFSHAAEEESLKGELQIPSSAISSAHKKVNSKLLSFSASHIAPKKIEGIFVPPPLAQVNERIFITRDIHDPENKNIKRPKHLQ